MENGRKFITQYEAQHSCMIVVGRNETTKSKKQRATVILFNDSLLIYYGTENDPHLVALVRWYSRTMAQKVKILDSSETSINVTSPRDNRIHFLTFIDQSEKESALRLIQGTIEQWFEEVNDKIAFQPNGEFNYQLNE